MSALHLGQRVNAMYPPDGRWYTAIVVAKRTGIYLNVVWQVTENVCVT